jgi:hypothetical protein
MTQARLIKNKIFRLYTSLKKKTIQQAISLSTAHKKIKNKNVFRPFNDFSLLKKIIHF